MIYTLCAADAPALGDIRCAGEADWFYILPDARSRADWSRYWEALGVAVARGAHLSFTKGTS